MTADLRARLTQLLHLQESPHRTALAFAVGVVIAFSPTYGLHTASVLFCAWAFRLNFLAVLTGSLINNPWTLLPIIGLTFWAGLEITNHPPVAFTWDDMSLSSLYEQVSPYILPFVAGGVLLSVLGGALSYPLALLVISRYRAARLGSHRQEEPLPPVSHLR